MLRKSEKKDHHTYKYVLNQSASFRGCAKKYLNSCNGILFNAFILAAVMVIGGILTIEPVFKLLGAEGVVLDYVKRYMNIWYLGNVFVVIPMVGNNIIRSLGDTKTPSVVMLLSAGINVVLDPLLIFGMGMIPAMGIEGAAIATVISRVITFVFAIYVLARREKVLVFEKVSFNEILDSWKQILFIGLPNALTKMIVSIATGVITGLIASYGVKAVVCPIFTTSIFRCSFLWDSRYFRRFSSLLWNYRDSSTLYGF